MRRPRFLRRLLVKYRASGKIDKHLYHELYHLSKGNTFKHKRALVEHVRRMHAIFVNTITNPARFTRPRPRSNVSACSRKKWTPSVRRPRPLVRGDKSVFKPRDSSSWKKMKNKWREKRNEDDECDLLTMANRRGCASYYQAYF